MEYTLGQIVLYAGNYVPRGFVACDGRTLPVGQYEALYAVIGNIYGGDQVNFKIPDLRGRVALSFGQGVLNPPVGGGGTLTNRPLASTGGTETATLSESQIPAHTHTFNAINTAATNHVPTNMLLANVPAAAAYYIADQAGGQTPTTVKLGSEAITVVGGNAPHVNMMPVLALTYMMCVQGIFPSFQ